MAPRIRLLLTGAMVVSRGPPVGCGPRSASSDDGGCPLHGCSSEMNLDGFYVSGKVVVQVIGYGFVGGIIYLNGSV